MGGSVLLHDHPGALATRFDKYDPRSIAPRWRY